MHSTYLTRIAELQQQLEALLAATPLKYSAWPSPPTTHLSASGGVSHFFEVVTSGNVSLYVGKAGLGAGKWSLFKRISQHFQTSRTNTLLGKVSKKSGATPEAAKTSLCDRQIYLQWLPTLTAQSNDPQRSASELSRL